MHAAGGLVSFLLEFITAAVVVPLVVAVIAALLELLISVLPVVLIVATVVVARIGDIAVGFPGFVGPETLDVRGIGEFQLTVGDLGELALDGIVMHGLFVPVVISQLHVISDGVGESVAFVGILFREGFVDDDLEIFAQMG